MTALCPAHEVLDQRYRPLSESTNRYHTLDVYIPDSKTDNPAKAPAAPVAIFVHGGGWKDFDKRAKTVGFGHQNWGKALSAAGILTVLPGYRKSVKVVYPTLFLSLVWLVIACTASHAALKVAGGLAAIAGPMLLALTLLPGKHMPAIEYNSTVARAVDFFAWAFAALCNIIFSDEKIEHPDHCRDVASAIRWVIDNIDQHGGDPTRIVLLGHSAGAHIVSMLMVQPELLRHEGIDPAVVKGLFLVSGPFSGKKMYEAIPSRFQWLHPAFGSDTSTWTESFPLGRTTDPDTVKRLNLPPFFLANAENDFGLEVHAEELAAQLRTGGVQVDTKIITGTSHMTIHTGVGKDGSEATKQMLPLITKFFNEVTGEPKTR